jgi:hypothetical protein
MKSIFNQVENQAVVARISRLAATSKAQWGKMSVDQMLVHVQRPILVAFGELKLKRTLIGFLFGGMAKRQLTSDVPWKKNLPTDKNFIVTRQSNFDEERQKLIALVQRFLQVGFNDITKEPHPFFGNLTAQEWDALMWKHLDHHLGQFGV